MSYNLHYQIPYLFGSLQIERLEIISKYCSSFKKTNQVVDSRHFNAITSNHKDRRTYMILNTLQLI